MRRTAPLRRPDVSLRRALVALPRRTGRPAAFVSPTVKLKRSRCRRSFPTWFSAASTPIFATETEFSTVSNSALLSLHRHSSNVAATNLWDVAATSLVDARTSAASRKPSGSQKRTASAPIDQRHDIVPRFLRSSQLRETHGQPRVKPALGLAPVESRRSNCSFFTRTGPRERKVKLKRLLFCSLRKLNQHSFTSIRPSSQKITEIVLDQRGSTVRFSKRSPRASKCMFG